MKENKNANILNEFLLRTVSHDNIDVIYVPDDNYVHACFYQKDPNTNRLNTYNAIIIAERWIELNVSISMNKSRLQGRKHFLKEQSYSCHGITAFEDPQKNVLVLRHISHINSKVIDLSDLTEEWNVIQTAAALIVKNTPNYF